jgi:hypothetical protein
MTDAPNGPGVLLKADEGESYLAAGACERLFDGGRWARDEGPVSATGYRTPPFSRVLARRVEQ